MAIQEAGFVGSAYFHWEGRSPAYPCGHLKSFYIFALKALGFGVKKQEQALDRRISSHFY
jgi:hypothetical protein